jgi:ABC-2 type transport system permease protein
MFGSLLDLPTWVADLSPFQRTPAVPADPFELLPVLALTGVAALLIAGGLRAFRARDLMPST